MNLRSLGTPLAFVLPATLLAACSTFTKQNVGLREVDELVERVEHVHVEAEVAKESVHGVLEAAHSIVDREFQGDAVAAHLRFSDAVEGSEKQAKTLNNTIERMERASARVFSKWNEDLNEFVSAEMRERSRDRMEATRKRYTAIRDSMEPAQAAYEAFNARMRDLSTFLDHDFNEASLSAIESDVRRMTDEASELHARLDACLEATEEYVRAASLPSGVEVTPEEGEEPEAN